jgi:8-oxo-dGTP diphosphatase
MCWTYIQTRYKYRFMTHPPLAVTVDLVLMSVLDNRLVVLSQRRNAEPFAGYPALPGGFVRVEEGLDEAACRILVDKAGFDVGEGAWLEQLYTFGDPSRDPRMRTVSVAYFALVPSARLVQAIEGRGSGVGAGEQSA